MAAAALTDPVTSGPSNVGGNQAGSISSASRTSADQSRRARSNSSVPDPSALSAAYSPVRWNRTKSFGSRTWATRAQSAGSWSRTQTSFGAVKPVRASLPVIRMSRSGPTAWRIASHSAPVRWSFHRIAGRSTAPASSSSTAPCIWPVRPMAWMSDPATPVDPMTDRIAVTAPSHQRPGSCSLQSGRGTSKPYSAAPTPRTAPDSSMRTAFVAVVDASMPRTNATREPAQPPTQRPAPVSTRAASSSVVQIA